MACFSSFFLSWRYVQFSIFSLIGSQVFFHILFSCIAGLRAANLHRKLGFFCWSFLSSFLRGTEKLERKLDCKWFELEYEELKEFASKNVLILHYISTMIIRLHFKVEVLDSNTKPKNKTQWTIGCYSTAGKLSKCEPRKHFFCYFLAFFFGDFQHSTAGSKAHMLSFSHFLNSLNVPLSRWKLNFCVIILLGKTCLFFHNYQILATFQCDWSHQVEKKRRLWIGFLRFFLSNIAKSWRIEKKLVEFRVGHLGRWIKNWYVLK